MNTRSLLILNVCILLILPASNFAKESSPPTQSGIINLRKTVTVSVVQKTKDAVVNISTTKIVSKRISPFGDDPFFRQFDIGSIVQVPANSLGSGFIVHRDGYVVTNNHVIDQARQINVELADGRKLPATLISSDAEADLAILKITSDKPLPTLELGDSSDLMIGEPVIAVGNPLGFSHSVSTGIVSAIHRDLKDTQGQVALKDLVQTDAAINPGNSGGPLLNAYAQVIGINTAIRGDAQNIGFAIQINRLRDLIADLMNPAQAIKVDVPIRLMERRRILPPASVVSEIVWTRADGQAPVVIAVNGQRPSDIIDAYALLLTTKVGQTVSLQLSDGSEHRIAARAVPLPDAIVQAKKRLGIVIEPVTPMLAQKYHLSTEQGMFVSSVDRTSIAAKAGIRPGDVIVQLGRYRVLSLEDFSTLLHHLPQSGQVRIGVMRGEQFGWGTLDF